MSKTVETLKRPSIKADVLDNHIVDTYFYQKTRPKIRKKKTKTYIKNIAKLILPLSVTLLLATCLVIFAPILKTKYHSFLKNAIVNAKTVKIVDRGAVNKDIVQNYEFRGYARKDISPKVPRDAIALTNPKKYNWADMAINFKFPVNLTNRSISLSMRGNVGGERVNIVIRDINNKSYRINDLYLTSKWSSKVIRLDSVKNNIDLSSIDHLRIECGYMGESSKEMDSPIDITVYIKNINLIKETRT